MSFGSMDDRTCTIQGKEPRTFLFARNGLNFKTTSLVDPFEEVENSGNLSIELDENSVEKFVVIKTERIIISTEGKFQKNFNKFKTALYLIFIDDKYEF